MLATRTGMEMKINKKDVELKEIYGIEEGSELAATLILYERVFNTSNLTSFSVKTITKPMETILTIMSAEVNKRLMLLRGYCQEEVLEELKSNWEDVYQVYQKTMVGCLQYLKDDGPAGVYSCLEENEWLTRGGRKTFMAFIEQLTLSRTAEWQPSLDEVRHMEAHVVVFRNYAHLRVQSLVTLINAFTKSGGKNAKGKPKYFLTVLYKDLNLFVEYGNFLHRHIKKHYEPNFEKMLKSQTCENIEAPQGAENVMCSFQFGSIVEESKCSIKVGVFSAQQHPEQCRHTFVNDNSDHKEAAKFFARNMIKGPYDKYALEMIQIIESYWTNTLLSSLHLWEEMKSSVLVLSKKHEQEDAINYKLKPHQMKQVNAIRTVIRNFQENRKNAKQHHGFVPVSFRDEL